MRRVTLALCSLVSALTLPAYAAAPSTAPAAEPVAAPSAAPAPSPAPAPAPSAKPEQQFSAEVLILHATNEKKGIDARIGKLPELSKAPFSTYDSYQVLDRVRLPQAFYTALQGAIAPGATILVTQSSVGGGGMGKRLTILDAVIPKA